MFAAACAAGNVLYSVIVGGVGIAFGAGLGAMQYFDGFRADIAKFLFFAFALVHHIGKYTRLRAVNPICTPTELAVPISIPACAKGVLMDIFSMVANFWAMFLIFTFNPCEILIPLVMYPASQYYWISFMDDAL